MKKNFSFNIKEVPNIYHKINPKLNEFPKFSRRQIEFGSPRPVREYRRFISFKESLTGVDPYAKYSNFINKDIIKSMKRPLLHEKFDIKSPNYKHISLYNTRKNRQTKWALGTVARAPDEEKLPKKQQFKIYYFPPEYNNKEPEKYRRFSLKTDYIGIKIPKLNRINSDKSFLKMKEGYSASNETMTENQWVPYSCHHSINNISSKNYDIINFLPINGTRKKSQILYKYINFRKKGIGEYYDLTNIFNKNFNKEFSIKYRGNPKRFYKYNGAFTHMYDVSNRNGKITLPFDIKQN